MRAAWLLALLLLPGAARAADLKLEDARREQLDSYRAEVASQLQLRAYNLLDELVVSWINAPPFPQQTSVVVADVSVPLGFGSGMQALVENHFAALLMKNPSAHLTLAHCPACTGLVIHSGAKGTIVSRGVDQPAALAEAGKGSGARHALFLDFEIEGAALVLRARITSLEPALPILYAKTLSTSTASEVMLRTPEHLKTAEEAHQEYLEALQGRGNFLVPVRFGVRTYQTKTQGLRVPPFVWLSVGLEVALNKAKAWTGNLSIGFSWAPESHVAWMAQARVARLLTGNISSLTRPDLYFFAGGAVISVYGQQALAFKSRIPTIEDLTAIFRNGAEPNQAMGAVQLGLELRVKERLSLILFVESAPGINDSETIGKFLDLGPLSIHAIAVEVAFCF